jgi:hypothetical protein
MRGVTRRFLAELVRAREKQHTKRLLVPRIGRDDIETDTFGSPRLIQQPITFGSFEGSWNGRGGQRLQLEHDHLRV